MISAPKKKIAILGFSREGKSTYDFIKNSKQFAHAEIWILDQNEKTRVPRGAKSILGKSYLKYVENFDIVFRTPGIPYMHPALVKARNKGVAFSSSTVLFFENYWATIIGITGTKGKGTTATLIYKFLKAAGKDAYLVGNIGTPSLKILPKLKKNSLVVFELSSFQLQDLKQSPHIAVILDIFPDHQEKNVLTAIHGTHLSFAEYAGSKGNICRYQRPDDAVFFFDHNKSSLKIGRLGKGKKIPVNERGFSLIKPEGLQIPGFHNYLNAIVATKVARFLNISPRIIRDVARRYTGLPHRLEFVKAIRTKHGTSVRFYNDSFSTSPQPTIAAIKAFPGTTNVLILGGYDKGLSYKPLIPALHNSSVHLVVLMGANRKKIIRAIKGFYKNEKNRHFKIVEAVTLLAAIKASLAFGASVHEEKINVIFSPATSSFDMFKNYVDRGEKFKAIVRNLKASSKS